MPRGDGTGPTGQGSGRGGGRGNWGGVGPGGQCVCSACGASTAHQPGMPCSKMTCPICGQPMRRG